MSLSVVIGANRGIGLELAKQLKAKGHDVVGVCRHDKDGALGRNMIQMIDNIDVSSDADARKLAMEFEGQPIGLLIHNAGIMDRSSLDEPNFDGIAKQFDVNAMGPLRIVSALQGSLVKGAKIGVITSRMGSIADNTSGGSYGYRMSKAAANAATRSMAHDLKDQSIAVAVLHPGYVRTEMTRHNGLIDTDESAAGLIRIMDELNLDNTGRFWHTNGEELPW